jgi:hypothetical protein
MIFPGFPSIENGSGVSNPPVSPRLGGSGDATFVEIALGLISPNTSIGTAPPATTQSDIRPGTKPASTARNAPAVVTATRVDDSVVRAPVSARSSKAAVANAALANSSSAAAPVTPAPDAGAPVALTSPQTQSMFSCVLTPAQYLENAMAEIQAGSPTSGDTPMTVAEVLQQVLANNYSTPQNTYAECSDPAAAAALIARIAGPNADVMVPTAAGMANIPTTPAGWVGSYTVGYATQSSGFNDAGETFNG